METVKLSLVGLEGNAFSLMGAFRTAARQSGWQKDEIDKVLNEAMVGDYDHMLSTLAEHCEDPEKEDEDEDKEEFAFDTESEAKCFIEGLEENGDWDEKEPKKDGDVWKVGVVYR